MKKYRRRSAADGADKAHVKVYQNVIGKEIYQKKSKRIAEKLLAGTAALAVGIYGYYNDNRGITSKMAYTATQTAGIFVIGSALSDATKPSLALDLHAEYQNGPIKLAEYRRVVANYNAKEEHSLYQQAAYTSGIMALTTGYAVYREHETDSALKSVNIFFGSVALLTSGYSFYRLAQGRPDLLRVRRGRLTFSIAPTPTATYLF